VPVIFRCKGCGSIIFVFERVGQDCFGLPAPSELAMRYEGKCPNCGRILETPTIDDVKVIGRIRQPTPFYTPEITSAPLSKAVI